MNSNDDVRYCRFVRQLSLNCRSRQPAAAHCAAAQLYALQCVVERKRSPSRLLVVFPARAVPVESTASMRHHPTAAAFTPATNKRKGATANRRANKFVSKRQEANLIIHGYRSSGNRATVRLATERKTRVRRRHVSVIVNVDRSTDTLLRRTLYSLSPHDGKRKKLRQCECVQMCVCITSRAAFN